MSDPGASNMEARLTVLEREVAQFAPNSRPSGLTSPRPERIPARPASCRLALITT